MLESTISGWPWTRRLYLCLQSAEITVMSTMSGQELPFKWMRCSFLGTRIPLGYLGVRNPFIFLWPLTLGSTKCVIDNSSNDVWAVRRSVSHVSLNLHPCVGPFHSGCHVGHGTWTNWTSANLSQEKLKCYLHLSLTSLLLFVLFCFFEPSHHFYKAQVGFLEKETLTFGSSQTSRVIPDNTHRF